MRLLRGRWLSIEAPEAPQGRAGAPSGDVGRYAKKFEESNVMIAMMDLLIKDLEKEIPRRRPRTRRGRPTTRP